MQKKNKKLFWLNDSRLFAATAIIFVHFVQNVQSTLNVSLDTVQWWTTNLYLSSTMWGVPLFVMISGSLLLSPEKQYHSAQEFYRKRLNRLGIPILFWTLFYLGVTYAKSKILHAPFDVETIGWEILGGRPYNHMWYLYMVFGLYLFTPYFRKISMHSSLSDIRLLVVFLFIISFLAVLTNEVNLHNSTLFIFMFPVYVSYFFAGYLITQMDTHIPIKYLLSIIVLFIVLTAVGEYMHEKYQWRISFYHNFSVTMIPLSLSIMLLIKEIHNKIFLSEKIRQSLAQFTLGAYLIHPVLVGIVVHAHYLGLNMQNYTFIKILILTSMIVIISLSIAYIFSKIPYLRRVV